jgi:hypothetical protein
MNSETDVLKHARLAATEPVEAIQSAKTFSGSPTASRPRQADCLHQAQSWLTKKLEVTYQIVKEQTTQQKLLSPVF